MQNQTSSKTSKQIKKPQSSDGDSQNSSDSQPQNPQLHPQQIQKALETLKKLKRIGKDKKLTDLKHKNKKVNSIFKEMSWFFIVKSQSLKKNAQQRKRLKEARKKALKFAGIRKPAQFQANASNQIQQCQYDPISEFKSQLKEFETQISKLKCYICKNLYDEIHHFYDCLCVKCGDFNFEKRQKTYDLNGFTALVTGARIKIGFETAVKLLRSGAKVIATTRFFNDAFLRYQALPDYSHWKDNLYIVQCDFTSSIQVSQLISTIKENFSKLDILINNAAQTIVRPKQFYLKELVHSTKSIQNLPEQLKKLQPAQSPSLFNRYPSLFLPQKQTPSLLALENEEGESPLKQIQEIELNSEKACIDQNFRDEFDQPLDKRAKNSWVQQLNEVSLIDCYTTQLVNSIVPFHLISELKPLMKKTSSQQPSFIINVSSMEGVFNRPNKQSSHPHTNMAKASLNMITRTSAQQFINDNIYMNSVDTGWVTEQNPYSEKRQRAIPLDCLDGALRVLDPIFSYASEGSKVYGQFLKDYKVSNW